MNFRHIVRNIVIAKFTYFGIAWIYRRWARLHGPLTRIVVFHDVPDRVWFEKMIAVLMRETRVLTPREFVDGVRDEERINTLITFDDGYASWVDVALPVLESKNLKALFFINSGLLDAASSPRAAHAFMRESLLIHPRSPLTWDGAAQLQQHGHTIGGHTESHRSLAELSGEEVRIEIHSDKQKTESRLHTTVTEFAYPFGTSTHFTAEAITAVERAGYVRAYTAISRFVRPLETFKMPRMCIEDDLTPARLSRWINGAYDLFDMLKQLCVR